MELNSQIDICFLRMLNAIKIQERFDICTLNIVNSILRRSYVEKAWQPWFSQRWSLFEGHVTC